MLFDARFNKVPLQTITCQNLMMLKASLIQSFYSEKLLRNMWMTWLCMQFLVCVFSVNRSTTLVKRLLVFTYTAFSVRNSALVKMRTKCINITTTIMEKEWISIFAQVNHKHACGIFQSSRLNDTENSNTTYTHRVKVLQTNVVLHRLMKGKRSVFVLWQLLFYAKPNNVSRNQGCQVQMDKKCQIEHKQCQTSWNRLVAVRFELPGWVMAKVQCWYGTKPRFIANR